MKALCITSIVCCLAVGLKAQSPADSGALQSLLSADEYRKYSKKADYSDRAKQFRHALERMGDAIDAQAHNRDRESLLKSLRDVTLLAHLIHQEPSRGLNQKDLRGKSVKRLEIEVRKLSQVLEAMKFSFPFDTQAQFDNAVNALSMLREQLLRGIFGQAAGRQARLMTSDIVRYADPALGLLPTALARRVQNALPSGDRFTEEELDKIRFFAPDVKKRVEIFLDIAERRMKEIQSRMKAQGFDAGAQAPPSDDAEKKKKRKKNKGNDSQEDEKNPLEYYTYWDLVHAYERAIDGITVNIDDALNRNAASRKDVKKPLEKLNKRMQEYLPQLEPILKMAFSLKDEDLYREVQKAIRISEIALKGSQLALGAPQN